jgi:uncharacterized membrane protein YeaQ/YmgE (transglycosylase-associated protein family)
MRASKERKPTLSRRAGPEVVVPELISGHGTLSRGDRSCRISSIQLKRPKYTFDAPWRLSGWVEPSDRAIASKIVNKTGEGVLLDIVLGVIGAVVGGWLFNRFGATGVTGLNVWSLVVATIGAVVVLVVYHALTGRGKTV